MNKTILLIFTAAILVACNGSKLGYQTKNEVVKMNVDEARDVINYPLLESQQIPSFAQRVDKQMATKQGNNLGQSSFMAAPLVGNLVSLATDGIKQMIEKDEKKFFSSKARRDEWQAEIDKIRPQLGEWQRMANAILLTLSESKKLWKNGNEYNLIEYYKKEFLIDF